MYESEVSVAEIEAVLERSRRRKDELDSEYEQRTAAVQAEMDERERVFQEEEERARIEEEQRREAERAVLRERARREQIRIGEQDDEDPFADQVSSGGFPVAPAPADVGGAQPPPPRTDAGWNVAAGRFGRSAPEEAPVEQRPPEPRPGPPPREQPASAPPPRRRAAAADDWDDDEEDFSQRSWLR
ncbi:hypothetical protein SAMN04487905_10275 [Actinopolyspora xinjiangensis]|uniref:Uncharacterized protein n=1 Tax=Actinopolyspora xinjiangensis TaxID=405564 RepID=A0A1H0Q4C6_9ACTN|nr:hypothetical protein [Actinopolyspora xinjiangensis]SDP12243.1 hypothetical protein SAMN04487905_10275 [Actinopolyspora xinjiangensis]